MGYYTYIAADFDNDSQAVNHLYTMKEKGLLSFLDAHELQQSNDDSLPCSIKKSLKYRLDKSYKFVLIVGTHTNTVSKGGCQLCQSYNSFGKYCVRGYSVDYRSFIKYECENAVEARLQIVILYNDVMVNRYLCPEILRWKGTHQTMKQRDINGTVFWDDNKIIRAIN